MKKFKLNRFGFTLVELLTVIGILSVFAYFGSNLLIQNIDESQFEETRRELKMIREGFLGNVHLKVSGKRSEFGYVGDLGGLPMAEQGLKALLVNPGVKSYSLDGAIRIGWGWNGPYLISNGFGQDFLTDGWGNPYHYFYEKSQATVTSYGSDGKPGGAGYEQDLQVVIPSSLILARVYGYLQNGSKVFTDSAEVEVYYPNPGGKLTNRLFKVSKENQGFFSISEIPFGIRSLKIYVPTKNNPEIIKGPIVFKVDGPHVLIPKHYTNVSK